MIQSQAVADILEQTFNKIHREEMQGIPILNPAIKVQALGFQEYQGRVLGVLITPWLMNVVMLPCEGDDWSNLALGHKQPHKFPSKTYKFMINEIEGVGKCLTHSLYSPMREFPDHQHAVLTAETFLDNLMVETEPTEEDLVDEELLGRIMRGEETPEVNLDEFAIIEPVETDATPANEPPETRVQPKKKLSRRDLLRGSFLESV